MSEEVVKPPSSPSSPSRGVVPVVIPVFPDGPFAQVPNFITCIVIASGCALMVGSSIPVLRPQYCIAAITVGLIGDIVDGMAARKLNACSKFGAAFDQLADLTCFGIGPAVFFMRAQLDGQAGFSVRELVCLLAGFAYMACSVARIARELIVHRCGRPTYFVGIPTNLACPFVVCASYFYPFALWLPVLIFLLSFMLVMNKHIDKDLGCERLTGYDVFGLQRTSTSAAGNKPEGAKPEQSSSQGLIPEFPGGTFAQVPQIITCFVVASGCALMVGSSIPILRPQYCIAAVCVGLLADVLDDLAARKLNACSKFGAAFDHLADLTCFGIGPAVFFMRAQLDGQAGFSVRESICVLAGFAYMACSVARIARELVVHNMERPTFFVGIPTNLACLVVVVSVYMYPFALWLPVLIFVLSWCLVSNMHIDKDLGLSWLIGRDVFGLKVARD